MWFDMSFGIDVRPFHMASLANGTPIAPMRTQPCSHHDLPYDLRVPLQVNLRHHRRNA